MLLERVEERKEVEITSRTLPHISRADRPNRDESHGPSELRVWGSWCLGLDFRHPPVGGCRLGTRCMCRPRLFMSCLTHDPTCTFLATHPKSISHALIEAAYFPGHIKTYPVTDMRACRGRSLPNYSQLPPNPYPLLHGFGLWVIGEYGLGERTHKTAKK